MHWSEEIAKKIIARNPDKEEYVCAAGVSPSGSIHIGNFRDIATPLFVVKALQKKLLKYAKKLLLSLATMFLLTGTNVRNCLTVWIATIFLKNVMMFFMIMKMIWKH